MPTFKDSNGREWSIRFDGLLLADLRDELKIDLADVASGDYLRLESDPATLARAVCFLCAEQLKSDAVTVRQLSAALVGESQDRAIEAIWGAAKVFFRPQLWSELQSSYGQQKTTREQWLVLRPLMQLLNQPEMPAALRDSTMEAVKDLMQSMSNGDLPTWAANKSATGPVETRAESVSNSPATAECRPVA